MERRSCESVMVSLFPSEHHCEGRGEAAGRSTALQHLISRSKVLLSALVQDEDLINCSQGRSGDGQ